MTQEKSTLILGGACRRGPDGWLVQRRSWEMLRIFADHLARPVFAMLEDPANETLAYPLPPDVTVRPFVGLRGLAKLQRSLGRAGIDPQLRAAVEDADVVYLRQPLWECWDAFRHARRCGKRVLASYHGDWGDALRRQEDRFGRRLLSMGLSLFIDYTFREIARHSEVLFCVGQRLYDKYYDLARHTVLFANFLHGPDDIVASRALRTELPCRILFVGHLEKYKGPGYLLRAVHVLRRRGLDWRLTVLGKGALEAELRRYVQRAGLEARVTFAGYVQHGPELMRYYRAADVLVLPSVASEGTAKVLMEAMTQGTPVVATDAGSTRFLLGDGRYGLVVPPKRSAALADAIERLWRDPGLRQRLIDNGLDLARASTRGVQEKLVGRELRQAVPDIMGRPTYLAHVEADAPRTPIAAAPPEPVLAAATQA